MENLRKSLVNNEQDLLKYTSRPTNITHLLLILLIFSKNYATIHEIKLALTLNKPIGFTVGFTVFRIKQMVDVCLSLHKKCFDVELSFTDTGRFAYEIKSWDLSEEFFNHKHLFDFSKYPKDSKFFYETNKNVIGKWNRSLKEK